MLLILLLSFFLSGFSSLVYEIIWSRILTVLFGVSIYGQSVVLILFMGGMAFGAVYIQRQRFFIRKPLRGFILLESIILTCGLLSGKISSTVELLSVSGVPYLLSSISVAVLFILPATISMGATFPVILRITDRDNMGKKIALLYSINTCGGLLGVLSASYVLIAEFGVSGTILLAAAVNTIVIIMAVSLFYFRKKIHAVIQDRELLSFKVEKKAFAALFISGFLTMAYELSWSRSLAFSFGSSTYTFSLVIASFLAGLALGASFFRKIKLQEKGRGFLLFKDLQLWSICGASLFAFIALRMPLISSFIYSYTFKSFILRQLLEFFVVFISALPVSFSAGMGFPLLCKILAKDNDPKQVLGKALFYNTIGAVFGSVCAGFFLIDWLGPFNSVLVYMLLHFISILIMKKKQSIYSYIFITILSLGFFFYQAENISQLDLLGGGYTRNYSKKEYIPDYLKNFRPFWEAKRIKGRLKPNDNKLISLKFGRTSAIGIIENNITRSLVIDGKVDASCGPFVASDMPTQTMLGFLPLLYTTERENALTIGLGSGVTAGVLSKYMNNVDAIEIEKEVVCSLDYFKDFNENIKNKDNVNIITKDARYFMRRSKDNIYDIVSSEPSNIWIGGVANLFTKEYFTDCRRILKKQGVMIQWLHVYKLSFEDFLIALKTFLSVFPETEVWGSVNLGDIFLVAGKGSGFKVSEEFFQKNYQKLSSHEDIYSLGIHTFNDFKKLLIRKNTEKIAPAMNNYPLHRDDYPILEFSAAKNMFCMDFEKIFKFLEKK